MDIQNGYKIIYESRIISESVLAQHLKATKTIPETTDVNITYKDATGTVITAETLKTFKLIYEKDGSLYGSTTGHVEATDTKILVYSGNDLLLGKVAVTKTKPLIKVIENIPEEPIFSTTAEKETKKVKNK